MLYRLVLGSVLVLSWFAGTILGVGAAALRTDAGRALLVGAGLSVANDALNGTLSVGEVGGSFLDGLVVRDLVLRDAEGIPVVEVERVSLEYGVRDLLSGRFSFGRLQLERPRFTLVQPAPERPLNISTLTGGGEPRRGPPPLIAFTNVEISDGRLRLETPTGPGGVGINEVAEGSEGSLRVRRIEDVSARLPYLRLSSPSPGENAILIQVGDLTARISDPGIAVGGARGRVILWSDSLLLALDRLRVRESRGALRGVVAWKDGDLAFDLVVSARHAVTDEIRGLVPGLPPGLAGEGDFVARTVREDVVEVVATDMVLEGARGGGRVAGRLEMVLGPGDEWASGDTRLKFDNFDLEFVRGFLDTLPLAGRLGGWLTSLGPRDRLQLNLDVTFRDSLVRGWPLSRLRGSGVVALGGPEGAVFDSFAVRESEFSLLTVRRMLPAVRMAGSISGTGTLHGPWLNPTFEGELRHTDRSLPETRAVGIVRLDATGQTLGVWADVVFDSLRLAGLETSFPEIGLAGTVGGRLALEGRIDSLGIVVDIEGKGGGLRTAGLLSIGDDTIGLRFANIELHALDLGEFNAAGPETGLWGRLSLDAELPGRGSPLIRSDLSLDSARLEGVRLGRVRSRIVVADSFVQVDTVDVTARRLRLAGAGRLGLGIPRRGSFRASARVDSLGVLEPLLVSWLGPLDPAVTGRPSGAVDVVLTVSGSLDDYELSGAVEASELHRGDHFVSHAAAEGSWASAPRILSVRGAVDSVAAGELSFSWIEFRLNGRPDSLHWWGRSRFGGFGAALGGGSLTERGGARTVTVDSLGLLLVSGTWLAEPGAEVVLSDSGVDFSRVVLFNPGSAGRIALGGRLPFSGPARLSGSVDALAVQDVSLIFQQDYRETGGELSGTFELRGTAQRPQFELMALVRDGLYQGFRAPTVRAQLSYRDRELTGDVVLHRAGQEILRSDLSLPLDLAFTTVEQRLLPGPLRVRAVADGVDMAFLNATVPNIRAAEGTLTADIGITGGWEEPRLTGRVEVRDGAVSFPALGVRHEELNGALVLRGDTIRVERLTLRSGAGTARVAGFVRLEELAEPVLRLRLTGENFHAIDVRDFLTLTASGDLLLTGTLDNPELTGRATATRGILYFADLVEKDVINLEDPLFAEVVDTSLIRRQGLGAEFESRFLDSLRIDSLLVEMGSDMWMRSSEANIQLAGEVIVSKLRDRYRLDGTLETPRGTYRMEVPAITREFTVTRGQVQYIGTADLDADLDIEARHVVRTARGQPVTVFVHIGGTLYEPELTLSSDMRPPISETEIISYLLFGESSVESFAGRRGVERRFFAQSVAGALTGQLEQAVISDIGIPLDYLQIRPGETEGDFSGWEMAVGKQFHLLGTTAFLTASQRICPKEAQPLDVGASLEFRLSREWLLATSVDPSRSCEVRTGSARDRYQFGFDFIWERAF